MGRITLYGWLQYDPTLFDDIQLPNGMTKELIVNEIIKRSGDLYTYYQHPVMLKTNIKNWFTTQYPNIDQIARSLLVTYEPLENYDRTEVTKRKVTNSGSDVATNTLGTSATTTLGTSATTTLGSVNANVHSGTQMNQEDKSAYDSGTYTPATKNTTTFNDNVTTSNTGTDVVANSGHDIVAKAGSDILNNQYGGITDEENVLHVFGNVGVTPNSRVLDEEIALRIKYNLYEIVAKLFETEFLIQIY